jgi:uncharacterized protein (DUF305 family)
MMKLFVLTGVLAVLASPAVGQDHGGHGAMPSQSPATAAYDAANMTMHENAIDYTGNADIDFLKSMIPHHRGAIDMSKVVLQYGTDPKIKALAEEIIKAQEAEIAMMEEMLAKTGQ